MTRVVTTQAKLCEKDGLKKVNSYAAYAWTAAIVSVENCQGGE